MDCMCKVCKFSKINNIINDGKLVRQTLGGKILNYNTIYYEKKTNKNQKHLSLKSYSIIWIKDPLPLSKEETIISQMSFSFTPLLCLVSHYLSLKYVSLPWKHLLNSPKLVFKSYMWVFCNILGKLPLYLYIDYFAVCFLLLLSELLEDSDSCLFLYPT